MYIYIYIYVASCLWSRVWATRAGGTPRPAADHAEIVVLKKSYGNMYMYMYMFWVLVNRGQDVVRRDHSLQLQVIKVPVVPEIRMNPYERVDMNLGRTQTQSSKTVSKEMQFHKRSIAICFFTCHSLICACKFFCLKPHLQLCS